MPGMPPPLTNERDQLGAFLAQQRYVLRLAAYGLTDDQLRLAPTASELSVGSVIKHVTQAESLWIDLVTGDRARDPQAYERGFQLDEESRDDLLAAYDAVAARTAEVLAGVSDLDQPVPVPPGVPWFPDDVDAWTVRWVLLHLIEETARHAGHADIVREGVDGATAFPLMAAAEGWPSTPWLEPWAPSPSAA